MASFTKKKKLRLADVTRAIQMLNESSIVYIPLLNCPSLLHQVKPSITYGNDKKKKSVFAGLEAGLIIAENRQDQLLLTVPLKMETHKLHLKKWAWCTMNSARRSTQSFVPEQNYYCVNILFS